MKYVVRLKLVEDKFTSVAGSDIIIPTSEFKNGKYIHPERFLLDLKEAQQLSKDLMFRTKVAPEAYGYLNIKYISIIKVGPKSPYPDYEVVDYKEF